MAAFLCVQSQHKKYHHAQRHTSAAHIGTDGIQGGIQVGNKFLKATAFGQRLLGKVYGLGSCFLVKIVVNDIRSGVVDVCHNVKPPNDLDDITIAQNEEKSDNKFA